MILIGNVLNARRRYFKRTFDQQTGCEQILKPGLTEACIEILKLRIFPYIYYINVLS
jgi:hypothetical protein